MPSTTSAVHGLTRDLTLRRGEDVECAMRRVDRTEVEAVCRHLLGPLTGRSGGRSADHPARPVPAVAGATR